MEELKNEMLNKKKWAVVGATQNVKKYGYKIYTQFKKMGYDVYPVNPVYDEVDGDQTYDDLVDLNNALGETVDCVNVVVSPKRAEKVVEDVIALGIENIWFQPGTFTEEIIDKAEEAGLNVVFYDCVYVELNKRI